MSIADIRDLYCEDEHRLWMQGNFELEMFLTLVEPIVIWMRMSTRTLLSMLRAGDGVLCGGMFRSSELKTYHVVEY